MTFVYLIQSIVILPPHHPLVMGHWSILVAMHRNVQDDPEPFDIQLFYAKTGTLQASISHLQLPGAAATSRSLQYWPSAGPSGTEGSLAAVTDM